MGCKSKRFPSDCKAKVGKLLTNASSWIHHAWHFYYALVLVVKVACGSTICLRVLNNY